MSLYNVKTLNLFGCLALKILKERGELKKRS